MRPGQNKRMRGRNRRGPNPLTRSFESNGPDVKVRGTAQHIAEKYTQLARDAHLSGDPVAAESYLQHAEHYYRIIAVAFQAQQAALSGTAPDDREDEDDDDFDPASDRFTFRSPQTVHSQQQNGQPFIGDRIPAEYSENGEPRMDGEDGQPMPEPRETMQQQPRRDRNFEPRPQNNRFRDDRRGGRGPDRGPERNQERGPDRGPDRNQERPFRNRERAEFGNAERVGGERNPAERQGEFQPRPPRPAPVHDDATDQPGLPSFLTAPVRPIAVIESHEDLAPAIPGDEDAAALRSRRRRRPRIAAGERPLADVAPDAGSDQD